MNILSNYLSRVKTLCGDDVVAIYLNDDRSGTTITDDSKAGNNGVWTSITLGSERQPKGYNSVLSDGSNDYGTIDNIIGDLDDEEHTCGIVAKVSGSGVWTDGTIRSLVNIRLDNNNNIDVGRGASNNELRWRHKGSGMSASQYSKMGVTTTDWFYMGYTLSKVGDYFKCYFNGLLESTKSGIDAYDNPLSNAYLCARNTNPSAVWNGNEGLVFITNKLFGDNQHRAIWRP